MGGYGSDALHFLVTTLFDLYVMVVALRFLMQWVRADYYNPVAQFVVKATSPLLNPLRRMIPGWGGLDLAALVLAIALLVLKLLILQAMDLGVVRISGSMVTLAQAGIGSVLIVAMVELLALLFNIAFFAIIIQAVLSWVSPGQYNPVGALLNSLTRPLLGPIQRFVPPIGGLDLSPLVALIGLQVAKMLVIPPLLTLA